MAVGVGSVFRGAGAEVLLPASLTEGHVVVVGLAGYLCSGQMAKAWGQSDGKHLLLSDIHERILFGGISIACE